MRRFGETDMLYVGDSALLTERNLNLMEDPKTGCRFVTRLPSKYTECKQTVSRAVDADAWEDLGSFSNEPDNPKHTPARYRVFETVVTLYGRTYRVLVVHSDAHDRRKTHALEKRLKDDEKEMTRIQLSEQKIKYACRPDAMRSRELLAAYKDQHYIERNFGFLKDPVIVNSLFLKTPRRIEALGLIFVLSLLVWRLMERTMRASLKETGGTVRGWVKRRTTRPTSFMMTTLFTSVMVVHTACGRFLAKPLTSVQEDYLRILKVSPAVFTELGAGMRLMMPGNLPHYEDSG